MLPATRSPWWALVFLIFALQFGGSILGLAMYRHDDLPPPETIASIGGVTTGIAAVLSLVGWLGGRATFVCATLGLLIGLAYMAYVYTTIHEGMADLGALLMMLMLGVSGLVVGMVIDIVRAVRAGRAS